MWVLAFQVLPYHMVSSLMHKYLWHMHVVPIIADSRAFIGWWTDVRGVITCSCRSPCTCTCIRMHSATSCKWTRWALSRINIYIPSCRVCRLGSLFDDSQRWVTEVKNHFRKLFRLGTALWWRNRTLTLAPVIRAEMVPFRWLRPFCELSIGCRLSVWVVWWHDNPKRLWQKLGAIDRTGFAWTMQGYQ